MDEGWVNDWVICPKNIWLLWCIPGDPEPEKNAWRDDREDWGDLAFMGKRRRPWYYQEKQWIRSTQTMTKSYHPHVKVWCYPRMVRMTWSEGEKNGPFAFFPKKAHESGMPPTVLYLNGEITLASFFKMTLYFSFFPDHILRRPRQFCLWILEALSPSPRSFW